MIVSGDAEHLWAERRTARVLWEMLLRNPRYRRVWVDFALREGLTVEPGRVNQEAVRRVVAIYLHDQGHPDFKQDPETPDQLRRRPWRDRINRVANAEHLTAETLGAILGSFEVDEKDTHRLLLLHSGVDDNSVVIGELPPPESAGFHKATHDTLVIMDDHYLGPNGLPRRHETTQIVVPRVDGLSYFPIRFSAADLVDITSVELLRGGRCQEPISLPNGTHEYRIEFFQPLKRDETAQIKYAVDFDYQSQPPSDYRRVIYGHLDRLSIYVRFDETCLPSRIWWTKWRSWEGDSKILDERPVELDDELAVHQDLIYIESAVVGFRWER
jgi:hypothetical protein